MSELYVDGGVIGVNPSLMGGTWACRLITPDAEPVERSGVLTTYDCMGPVSNNQSEMLALLEGLKLLPADFTGTVYSDSQITLGRAFLGWKWSNIPGWMHKLYQEQRTRLVHWEQIKHVLLAGHPTKKQLAAGVGRHGYPVSEHNVWCDKACREAGDRFMAAIEKNIPRTEALPV